MKDTANSNIQRNMNMTPAIIVTICLLVFCGIYVLGKALNLIFDDSMGGLGMSFDVIYFFISPLILVLAVYFLSRFLKGINKKAATLVNVILAFIVFIFIISIIKNLVLYHLVSDSGSSYTYLAWISMSESLFLLIQYIIGIMLGVALQKANSNGSNDLTRSVGLLLIIYNVVCIVVLFARFLVFNFIYNFTTTDAETYESLSTLHTSISFLFDTVVYVVLIILAVGILRMYKNYEHLYCEGMDDLD